MSSVHKLLLLGTLWWLDSMISAAAGRPNTSGGFNTSSALMGLAAGAIGGAVLGELVIHTLEATMSLKFVFQHMVALLPAVCPSMTIPFESIHVCNHNVEVSCQLSVPALTSMNVGCRSHGVWSPSPQSGCVWGQRNDAHGRDGDGWDRDGAGWDGDGWGRRWSSSSPPSLMLVYDSVHRLS